jgi:hypothetical protein
MKRFLALLWRVREAGPSVAKVPAAVQSDLADHSSMADFVRILQEQDRLHQTENA